MLKKTRKNTLKGGNIVKSDELTEKERQESCPICNISFNSNEPIIKDGMVIDNRIFKTNCDHLFHIGCLYPYCKEGKSNKCPYPNCEARYYSECVLVKNRVALQYPEGTTKIIYNKRELTELPPLPNTLTHLYCSDNKLKSLPNLPNGLHYLDCNNNDLTALPPLPDSITYMYCNHNQLKEFPNLSNMLENLECKHNELKILPPLPPNIRNLYCSNNQLKELPELNDLVNLYCENNELKNLPPLPNRLVDLYCDNNELETLPSLPDSLTNLKCNNNKLKELPLLPSNIMSLHCGLNPLETFPDLNSLKRLFTLVITVNQVFLLKEMNFSPYITIYIFDEWDYPPEITKEVEKKYEVINNTINALISKLGERLVLRCPMYQDKANNIVNLKSTEKNPLHKISEEDVQIVKGFFGGKQTKRKYKSKRRIKRKTNKKKRTTRKKNY